ncbi:MAG: EVE domain-containing protein [Methylohalobius sp.]|nr:EVE domain-containing protein [Methylohalobius sp.]
MSYWLLKSEPSVFSLDDLARSPKQTVRWDGVRNYQARNFLRDQMHPGDLAFFYHSSCKLPGIVGIVEIVRSGYPDPTAWDKESPYFDPKSLPARPRWFAVDVKLVSRFTRTIALSELRCYPELAGMPLLKRGNRLSVLPIDPKQWNFILSLVPDTSLPTLS